MLLMVCIPFYTLLSFFAIYLINSQLRYLSSRKRRKEWLPKSAAKRLPDGSLVSPPLEDMAPFLPEEELRKLMLVRR